MQQYNHNFAFYNLQLTNPFEIFPLQMCLQDVKVPATAGCMVDRIMDQAPLG